MGFFSFFPNVFISSSICGSLSLPLLSIIDCFCFAVWRRLLLAMAYYFRPPAFLTWIISMVSSPVVSLCPQIPVGNWNDPSGVEYKPDHSPSSSALHRSQRAWSRAIAFKTVWGFSSFQDEGLWERKEWVCRGDFKSVRVLRKQAGSDQTAPFLSLVLRFSESSREVFTSHDRLAAMTSLAFPSLSSFFICSFYIGLLVA